MCLGREIEKEVGAENRQNLTITETVSDDVSDDGVRMRFRDEALGNENSTPAALAVLRLYTDIEVFL